MLSNEMSNIVLFQGMRNEEILRLSSCHNFSLKKYNKAIDIISVEEIISQIGIVVSGAVQVTKTDRDGNRTIISLINKYGVFAETFAFLNCSSPVAVTAIEETRILWLNANNILNTCASACSYHIKLIKNLFILMALKNIDLSDKLELVSKRSIKDKIIHFLNSQSELNKSNIFTIPYNRGALADYLCVDRSALSREISNLKSEGFLDYDRNTFKLLY